jgi:hemoglobin-like flavoprotein
MQWSSVCLVRNNAAALAPKATSFADDFLDRFVRECPELSRVVTWNREERRRCLLDTFAAVIKQAGNSQALSARLLVISANNERRGVRLQHYQLGREIVLSLLATYNGPSWTRGLAAAWEELLDHVLIHLSPPQSFEEALAA